MLTRRDFLGMLGTAGAVAALPSCAGRRLGTAGAGGPGASVDRLAVLKRHGPRLRTADQAGVLSVGNGNFAFNVDCTGLQSLHAEYKVIPLATLAHWAWHTAPVPAGVDPAALRLKEWPFYGRTVPYATDSSGQTAVFNYLRENPHMLNLGRVGLVLDGRPLTVAEVADVDQQLDLHTGVVTSRFTLAGAAVEVVTCCHPEYDGIGVRVRSGLLAAGRLAIEIAFPYGESTNAGDGADWTKPGGHTTTVYEEQRAPKQVTLNRTLDATRYGARVGWPTSPQAALKEVAPHTFVLTGGGAGVLEASINFDTEPFRATPLYTFEDARRASATAWDTFWGSGAALDLGECTDARAPELERRIVLSQYQTAIHCAGQYPSQETGLLCNSWYGKFHLEMHWWHSVHFTVWDRQKYFGKTMFLYYKILDGARARARRQGFKGARWPKMIGPDGEDSPSSVGPLLIWQQPHPIYYAELSYRDDPTVDTLRRWREIVVETAEFMASFAQYVQSRDQYVLGPVIKTVSENNPTETTLNPTWEVTAWRMGLRLAQTWLERLGQPRNAEWDRVLAKLAPAPVEKGVYLMQEGMDTYSEQWAWEHPALLGALGVLPGDGIDLRTMAATARKVRETWDFGRVWGWDFPTAAMCAARTLQPELAVDYLTMDAPMNRYLTNGCNFQRDNVPAYYPGNGGLLSAVGMMSGGWTGGPGRMAGWPKDGKWNVRAEGFREWL
jgi:hypothetical protein